MDTSRQNVKLSKTLLTSYSIFNFRDVLNLSFYLYLKRTLIMEQTVMYPTIMPLIVTLFVQVVIRFSFGRKLLLKKFIGDGLLHLFTPDMALEVSLGCKGFLALNVVKDLLFPMFTASLPLKIRL